MALPNELEKRDPWQCKHCGATFPHLSPAEFHLCAGIKKQREQDEADMARINRIELLDKLIQDLTAERERLQNERTDNKASLEPVADVQPAVGTRCKYCDNIIRLDSEQNLAWHQSGRCV